MTVKTHALTLLDAEEISRDDTPRRINSRKGRPLGSRTRPAHTHVTADEFAFLRAVAQGIDVTSASRQYLAWPGRTPERAALERFTLELLERVSSGALALADSNEARLMARKLYALKPGAGSALAEGIHQIGLAERPETRAEMPDSSLDLSARATIPSLEEFAAAFPEDMYTESELVELYAEEYPDLGGNASLLEAPSASVVAVIETPSRLHVLLEAIDWLSERLVVVPERSHRIEQWLRLGSNQRQAITSLGVQTVGEFADWINAAGPQWHAHVPRFGVARARALEAWFLKWGLQPLPGTRQKVLPEVGKPSAPGLRPLTFTEGDWPDELLNEARTVTAGLANALNAKNDAQALQSWHESIQEKSQSTQVAYRRAVERLTLWAVRERGKSLSALVADDLVEFRKFLREPPDHWVQAGRRAETRSSPYWRPLLEPLNEKSLDLTFVAVSALFSEWHSSGYIDSNPMEQFSRDRPKVYAPSRSGNFTPHHRTVIAATLDSLDDAPAKRRLAAALALLETTGLRREELTRFTWRHMQRIVREDALGEDLVLCRQVGNTQGAIRIDVRTVHALELHRADRIALATTGKLWRFRHIAPEDMPLLGVLDDKWIATLDRKHSEHRGLDKDVSAGEHVLGRPASTPPSQAVNANGRLSSAGVYAVIKTFFRKCEETARREATEGDEDVAFSRALMRWLKQS